MIERVAVPVDCDSALRPVMVSAAGCPSRLHIPPHSHRRAEFVYVGSGTLTVTAHDRLFTIPSQNAILIPPGTVHEMRMLSDASVFTLYIATEETFGGHCRELPVSGLLRELIQAAVELPAEYRLHGRDAHIMELITEELAWLNRQPAARMRQTPVPRDPRLLRVCREILRELERTWSIDEASKAAGMGRRTFTRAFRREMGVSFSSWCQSARLNAAVCRLSSGASITEVALEAGYNSPSAFATMFKRTLGVPPSTYQADHRPGGGVQGLRRN
ncbi:AraC family transcriptional regulator [Sphingosinithalassobacter portus]|uniref:AraC family transcriptional regulator n=1 Tax=Stakelama portus TaxID=2676234 RepID=UPI000D6EAE02|nr:helix-turn-helix transcriptional regulator [Sphingosinithalassobacter portus]